MKAVRFKRQMHRANICLRGIKLAANADTAASCIGRNSQNPFHPTVLESRVEIGPIKRLALSSQN